MDNRNKHISTIIFAIILPFWTLIASIKFFKSPTAKNWFWYACAFMGYIFIFNPIGSTGSETDADSSRIAQSLQEMHSNPMNFETVSTYFYSEEGSLDIYQELIVFILSRFTANAHYLFLIFAIIFGYFYSRNIWIITSYTNSDKQSWYIWIVLIMFFLINPIWQINGGRMWIALHVFMYGLFSFYLNNDKKKIIWCFLSVLIHFSFLLPLVLILIYQFLPKKSLTIYFILYFVAISMAEIKIQPLKEALITFLPAQLSSKAESYMNEDSVQAAIDRNASYSLYLIMASKMARYFILIFIAYFWVNFKKLFQVQLYQNLLALFLFLATIFEVLSVIPSMGRFLLITNMIFYSLLLLLLFDKKLTEDAIKVPTKYLSLLLILPVLLSIRLGLEYYGATLFYGNFFSSTFIEDRKPLIGFLKSFL